MQGKDNALVRVYDLKKKTLFKKKYCQDNFESDNFVLVSHATADSSHSHV